MTIIILVDCYFCLGSDALFRSGGKRNARSTVCAVKNYAESAEVWEVWDALLYTLF